MILVRKATAFNLDAQFMTLIEVATCLPELGDFRDLVMSPST